MYNWGKEGHEAVETKWDRCSWRKFVYAVASDDTHHYKEDATGRKADQEEDG
ncbi:hypothetical protein MASR1M31_11450 [Porphyromonadaceae bacterium]